MSKRKQEEAREIMYEMFDVAYQALFGMSRVELLKQALTHPFYGKGGNPEPEVSLRDCFSEHALIAIFGTEELYFETIIHPRLEGRVGQLNKEGYRLFASIMIKGIAEKTKEALGYKEHEFIHVWAETSSKQ